MENIHNEIKSKLHETEKSKKGDSTPLFIDEFFNIEILYGTADLDTSAMDRVVNALIGHMNSKGAMLPKYLVVIIDKDMLHDVDQNLSYEDATIFVNETVRWVVRQISTAIRRKKADLLEKFPGAISGLETKVIYVRMLRRIGKYHEESSMYNINLLRLKFNDALNDAAAKVEHYMLRINSCQSFEDFERSGNLSIRRKTSFWYELDNLIERFDRDKVKLKPTPKNPPAKPKQPAYDAYYTSGNTPSTSHQRRKHTPNFNRCTPTKNPAWRHRFY